MVRAHLDKRPSEVSAMFDRVAERYDVLNDVLSLGRDRRWRRVVAVAVGARSGELVLDLAAGTGTVSRALTGAGADCVACDFSLGMLRVGARRLHAHDGGPGPDGGRPGSVGGAPGSVSFVAGDALRLPFRDGAFDAVTISFGLRNVADPATALTELRRVTRPGGRLVICEFGHLRPRALDALYTRGLAVTLPAVARTLSRNPAAYNYLAESIRVWPDGQRLADWIEAAGWSAVRWRNLTMGVVAVHLASNPAAGDGPVQEKV